MGHGDDLHVLYRAARDNEGPAGDEARKELANRPVLTGYEQGFYEAWRELDSERELGMGAGKIRFTSIIRYAEFYGFSPFQTDELLRVIRLIDNYWIEATNEKRAKANK